MWTCICWIIIFNEDSSLPLSRVWWRAMLLQRLMQAHGVFFCICFLHSQCWICISVFAGSLSSFSPTMIWSVFGAEVNAGRLCIFFIISLVFVFLYFCICEIIIFILTHQGFMACQPLEASWVQRLMQADGEIISGELSGFLHIANFKFLHGNHTKFSGGTKERKEKWNETVLYAL